MAVIVEDGTVVADANAYIDVAYADAFWLLKPDALVWSVLTVAQKEASIIQATRKLDKIIKWKGSIFTTLQTLSWPRVGVCDCEQRTVPQDIVPTEVQNATAILSLFLFNQSSGSTVQTYNDTRAARVEEVRVEDVQITYFESEYGAERESDSYPVAMYDEIECLSNSGFRGQVGTLTLLGGA